MKIRMCVLVCVVLAACVAACTGVNCKSACEGKQYTDSIIILIMKMKFFFFFRNSIYLYTE